LPLILVDEREKESPVPSRLKDLKVQIAYKQLSVGDYVVSRRVCVERKTVQDFVSSIFDGRLFDQAARLKDAYELPLIIIEGGLSEAAALTGNPRVIWGAVASLITSFKLSLLTSKDPFETAELLRSLALKEQAVKGMGPISRRKPSLETMEDWQLYVAQSLPGVGRVLADKLLSRFKTVRALFTAKEHELEAVVGPAKARRIIDLLNAPYDGGRLKQVELKSSP